MSPTVSVVIPAYNAAPTLAHCLSALQHQTQVPDEIIVVDDGSNDGTADLAQSHGVQVLSQENAGPAAARNAGAQAARGELLLFTDADCVPDRDWVERMVVPFTDPNVAGVKGVYRTRQRELVARFVQVEYQDRYDRMQGRQSIDFVDTYSAGYRRDLFLAAGGFDTTFPTASVEDQEFSFRLARAGHRLVFVPDARVAHLHDETLREYVQRKFWIGFWKALVTRRYPSKLAQDSHTPQILKVQMGLAAAGGALVGLGAWRRRRSVAGLVCWAGFVLTTLPFVHKAWKRDREVGLVAPVLLFARAWSLGIGFVLGNLRWLRAPGPARR